MWFEVAANKNHTIFSGRARDMGKLKEQGNFWLPRRREECAPELRTLADYVIPRNQYEKAVKRPLRYLLIYVKTTTQDNCRQRTNVLPSEGGFNQVGFQGNIPQELLKYLKRQNLSPVPLLPAMQEHRQLGWRAFSKRSSGRWES